MKLGDFFIGLSSFIPAETPFWIISLGCRQVSRANFIHSWVQVPPLQIQRIKEAGRSNLWQVKVLDLEREADYHAPWPLTVAEIYWYHVDVIWCACSDDIGWYVYELLDDMCIHMLIVWYYSSICIARDLGWYMIQPLFILPVSASTLSPGASESFQRGGLVRAGTTSDQLSYCGAPSQATAFVVCWFGCHA